MKKKILNFSVLTVLVAADQLIKLLVINKLKPIGFLKLIPGFLRLSYVENTGAAFGIFRDNTAVLTVFTAAIITVCLYFILIKPLNSKIYNALLIVIVAGGIGNLIDRVFRLFVIDYIEVLFINFPVFNFADILVTTGSFALAAYLIYDSIRDKRSSSAKVNKNV